MVRRSSRCRPSFRCRLIGVVAAVKAIRERDLTRAAARCRTRRVFAADLIWIGFILVEREPNRQLREELIIDDLDGDLIVGRHVRCDESVYRLRVESAVANETVAPHIAGENRRFKRAALCPRHQIVIQIAIAAGFDAISAAIDLAARARAEVDRAAGSVVSEKHRRWPAIHIDASIGVGVCKIGSRKPVWLRYREAVLKNLDVADAKAIPRIRAAYR